MRFTSFYANGAICTPTHVALLTGRYPQRFGLYGGLEVDSSWGLPADTATLPRLLRGAGYDTALVGKWHLGHAEEEYRPLAQGFDAFFGFLHARHLPKTYNDPRLCRGEEPDQVRPGYLTHLLTEEAAALLRRWADAAQPFFLNLWYFAPHKPLEPPPRWAERHEDTVAGRFAALVAALDESVGSLLAVLYETGLAGDTMVVFLSNNGGARDVHGGRNGPLRAGKGHLLEGGVRVPLIVRWPGRVAAGTVHDGLTASFDLLPTIADLAGVDLTGVPVDGRSLAADLAGEPGTSSKWAGFEGPLFWEAVQDGESRFAVRRGLWKLHSTRRGSTLHDIRQDPGERDDLAADRPEVVNELEAAYRQWRSQLPPPADLNRPAADS